MADTPGRGAAYAGRVAGRAADLGTARKVKTPAGQAPVIPIIILGAGAYLVWFGIHWFGEPDPSGGGIYWPTTPVKSVLQGKGVPKQNRRPSARSRLAADIAGASSAAGAGAGQVIPAATGSAIADDALRYKGQGYVWGGNAAAPGHWDCSSFVSYVLGHDLGMALPGGGHYGDPGYPPHSHGPTTLQYLLYGQPVTRADVRAGDLIVSADHMGIAIDGGRMISAQDEQLGTGIGDFPAGFPGGPPHYRRVSAPAATTSGTNPYPGGISGRP